MAPVAIAAQERGVRFEENPSWVEVLAKARADGKYIFMDCYAVWCGPCKTLDKEVFSKNDVGDIYNERFINVKYDMEKGEGARLKEKYGVSAYPTLLFIDAKNEEVVHRTIGARDVKHFLEQADVAGNASNNLQGARKQYEENEGSLESLEKYLEALAPAGMRGEQERVTATYLEKLPDEKWLDEKHWQLLERYLRDPLSAPLQRVFDRRQFFARALGADRVDKKLSSSLQAASLAFLDRKEDADERFDEARYEALLHLVLSVEDAIAPACAVQLLAAGSAHRRDFPGMISAVRDALKYNMVQGKLRPVFCMTYLIKLLKCTDNAVLKEGAALADEIIAITGEDYTRASYHEIKAMILEAAGDADGAREAREKGHAHMRSPARVTR